jgi:hypothetical protein
VRLATHIRDKALSTEILELVNQQVIGLDGSNTLYITSSLMEVLYDFKKGDPV